VITPADGFEAPGPAEPGGLSAAPKDAMGPRWRQVCGTGHRELDGRRYNDPARWEDDIWTWVRAELRRVLIKCRDLYGTQGVISGMALGLDLELFEAAEQVEGLAVHACVPFNQQCKAWPKAAQARWSAAVARAATVQYAGDLHGMPTADRSAAATRLLFDRNDKMLIAADAVIALYDPARNHNSGTHDTVEKATGRRRLREAAGRQRIHLPVIQLNPATRRVGIITEHLPTHRYGGTPSMSRPG
jgi:uncharacterized phage-like protein YoqJ